MPYLDQLEYKGTLYDIQDSALKEDLNATVDLTKYNWEIGAFGGTGQETSSTTRIRSDFIPVTAGTRISISSGTNLNGVFYAENKSFLENMSGWSKTYSVPDGATYFRFLVRASSSNPAIADEDIPTLVAKCSLSCRMPQDVFFVVPRINATEDATNTLFYTSDLFTAKKGGTITEYPTRVGIPDKTLFPIGTTVIFSQLKDESFGKSYKVNYVVYNTDSTTEVDSSSGWIDFDNDIRITIGANQYLSLSAKFDPESDTSAEGAIDAIASVVHFFVTSVSGEIRDLNESIGNISGNLEHLDSKIFSFRNGSLANLGNSKMICMSLVEEIPPDKKAKIEYMGDLPNGYYLLYQYASFTSSAKNLDPFDASEYRVVYSQNNPQNANQRTFDLTPFFESAGDTEKYFAIAIAMFAEDGTQETLRTETYAEEFLYRKVFPDTGWDNRNTDNAEVDHFLINARQIPRFAGTPLTFLHFSDIHADKSAMKRIINDAKRMATNIDDIICTGDMVSNQATEITTWWDAKAMTCIGNHDSAVYDSVSGYDWTALSMADRDAYYIAPFESNWGVTHTSGTSYYYKDYASQNVRLIVMDSMLYTDNGEEATAQTAWLNNLLEDAITNELHVVIAIHAPHGGAMPVDCSFTMANELVFPTRSDCNTPQIIIDAVATKIASGMKFIGYLCGHVHQDDIWDAEGDGTQLMYAVTCANSASSSAWWYSDQTRNANEDAYNLVTIDTANTLVKIVRGGGANVDCNGRTRKYICFNYSTGAKVGEVL